MSCNQARHNMALNGDRSSTTENCMLRVTGLAWTGNTMSPKDVVEAPLNPDNIRPRFSRFKSVNPICLITNTCKRSAELPESTKIRLTSKSLIPNVKIRASWCGCNIRLGSTRGKVITPSIGRVLPLVNPGRMELTCSCTNATRNSIFLFRLELYSSSRGPPWILFITALGATKVVGAATARPWHVSPPLPSERTYCFKCPTFTSFSTK